LAFQHGELILYERRDGVMREITAIITRDELGILNELGDNPQISMKVSVADDSTTGISRGELDTELDFIWIARKQGGERKKVGIARVLNDKVGRLLLAIY
jgi:hypothetical protein